MQEIMKDFVNQLVGIANSYGMFGYKDTGKVSLVRKCSQCLNILYRDGMFVNHLIFNETIPSVHGDVAVYQFPFLEGGEVVDNRFRASGSDEYLDTFSFCFGYGCEGRRRNFVSVETNQRPVYIEKQGFYHTSFL